MNSLRTFISPVFFMALLAGPMLQAGTLAAGRSDKPAANAEASLPPGVMGKTIEPDKLVSLPMSLTTRRAGCLIVVHGAVWWYLAAAANFS